MYFTQALVSTDMHRTEKIVYQFAKNRTLSDRQLGEQQNDAITGSRQTS